LVKTTIPVPGGDPCNGQYAIPPHLAEVRELERQAAGRQGAYYWDWSAAMGGACSMVRFAAANPPLGMPDHVHMRSAGYALTADALLNTLMRAYDRYRGATGGV
jgi:lysophospholipase L1-like esterase